MIEIKSGRNIWKDQQILKISGGNIAASKVVGAVHRIGVEEVWYAMNNMKNGKSRGPSGVVLGMLKAGGEPCLNSLTAIFIAVLFEGKLPEECMLSSMVPIFKEEEDFLSPNSYRGIKRLYGKVLDGQLHILVNINKMQYRLMLGKGTADAVFILRRLTEKFRSKNKKLLFVFVDLEKAFDQVPRKVIGFALRQYLVNGVMSMHQGCKTVAVEVKLSDYCSVKVVVHQGSA